MFRKTIRKDEGFTLIELLIVVAIIAILAAIAIPQFQKYKYRANKASVESDLKNAYTASQVYLTDNPTATVDSIAKLQAGGWVKSADTLFNGTPTMTLSAGNIKLYSVTLNGAAKQNIAGMEFNGTVTSNTILASSF